MSEAVLDNATAEPQSSNAIVEDFSRDKQVLGVPWGKALMWIFLLS